VKLPATCSRIEPSRAGKHARACCSPVMGHDCSAPTGCARCACAQMRKPVGGLAHFDAMMDNWERLINEGKYAEGLTELENTLSGVPGLPPLEELQTMARRPRRPAAASNMRLLCRRAVQVF